MVHSMKVWHNKPENIFQCKKKIQYIVELFLLLNEQPAPLNSKDVFYQQQVEKTMLAHIFYEDFRLLPIQHLQMAQRTISMSFSWRL